MSANVLERWEGELVASCQADPGTPLDRVEHILAMAEAAANGGAAGLRLQGVESIRAVKRKLDLPVIGLIKARRLGTEAYITPTVADVEAVAAAGAEVVAFDATNRPRPDSVARLCEAARRLGRLAMADVSTAEEGRQAMEAGADIVSTTLAGYTPYSRAGIGPDFALMQALRRLGVPFAAEGRIWTPEEASRSIALGARFVVVGSAITRPDAIARRFVEHLAARSLPAQRTGAGS